MIEFGTTERRKKTIRARVQRKKWNNSSEEYDFRKFEPAEFNSGIYDEKMRLLLRIRYCIDQNRLSLEIRCK